MVLVEFLAKDIAAVPFEHVKFNQTTAWWSVQPDGKMRVKKFKIIKRVKW